MAKLENNDKTKTENRLFSYIKKYNKNRNKELKYDFMPKILEIIEKPANKVGSIIIIGIFVFLVVCIVWACLSKIDVVITSSGSIEPQGKLSVVQSYSGGTVTEINVTEGAYVKKGDVLVRLNTENADIDIQNYEKQKSIYESQIELYKKAASGDKLENIVVSKYEEELQPYIKVIIDADKSYYNLLENLDIEKENADLSKQIAELQLKEYERSGTSTQKKVQELTIKQQELSVKKIELQIKDTKQQYSSQVNSRLSELSSGLEDINTNIEKYESSKKYQVLTAPVSGYINSININTLGQTAQAGQDLITIVPENEKLEMTCYVKNMDIADISINMDAEIKLEAYPYNRYGTVKGKVTYISPSSFNIEEMGSVYLVKVSIDEASEDVKIFSGLTGQVEIKIGQRSVMRYFLDPIVDGLGNSLKEK